MEKKTVLNLSAMDFGGAGKFAVNFNSLLIKAGYDSFLVAKDIRSNYQYALQYPRRKTERSWSKLSRQVAKWKWSKVSFDQDRYFYGTFEKYSTVSAQTILALLPEKPDVIFIHWVTNFINTRLVNELHQLTGAKIVWLMLDNAPITGGCHFPWNCTHYQRNCADCPAIIDAGKKGLAHDNWTFKKKYLTQEASLLVFSQNDYERAVSSSLFGNKRVLKMPGYFVNENVFRPGNRQEAKAVFDIPETHRVIFFGATSLVEKRKGIHLFLEAVKRIAPENTTLLIAGSMSLPFEIPFEHTKMVGNLTEEQLIRAYQAADVFVCPTLEDSGPTMINQAVMCGTPVVSFKTGLGKDLVITGKTGYLAQFGSAEDLAVGIEYVLGRTDEEQETMARNCRALALELYGGVESYLKKVQEVIEG